jgi:hypothetical protein
MGDYKTGKSVYPEVGMQLAAYRRATIGWTKNGTEIVPPATAGAVVLHVRPKDMPGGEERGYSLRRSRPSDDVFDVFLAAKSIAAAHREGRAGRPRPRRPATTYPTPKGGGLMAGRILTLQRQARELGRLRTGYTTGEKSRPVRSDTWILTSHSEHYMRAAAEEFGGTCREVAADRQRRRRSGASSPTRPIDAIMPPGDPLSQTNELWSGGGCQRRCDGVTEQLSDSPCLCLAQHGEQWHEQPKGKVCAATTRLNVILPDMPDVGIYRVETHSFYAANEIAATVDLIRNATGGHAAVPIRLRIEQRQRVANGQTKKFPVVVVELRGATAGQILGGVIPGITARDSPRSAVRCRRRSRARLPTGPM